MEDERSATPTKEDLLKLPRWARVAFAARCARRGQPFFNAWKGATKKHLEDLDRAMALCEASARSGRIEITPRDVAAAREASLDAYRMCRAADAARHKGDVVRWPWEHDEATSPVGETTWSNDDGPWSRSAFTPQPDSRTAAFFARHTAATARAAEAASATTARASAANAAAAARIADIGTFVTGSTWTDFDLLLALATAEAWTDATPVDVSRLGLL